MAAILLTILNEEVDEDATGIEPIFHHENRFEICCHLGGVGEHIHAHTHNT